MLHLTQEQKAEVNGRFSENALKMLQKRYFVQMEDGTLETPADMFARVAQALAAGERNYGKKDEEVEGVERDFFEILSRKEYTPAGRTMRNAGAETALVANCIVLPIHDSMDSIFQTLKDAALLQQAGSGLGFDLSEMRPAMTPTKKSQGVASGPVSFLKVYDAAFGTIKQQSRNGANMAMMRVDHPDVLDFIHCKEKEGDIRNFNITVNVTDEFMRQLEEDPNSLWYCTFKGEKVRPHQVLRHPNGSVYDAKEIDITVKEIFDELVEGAWLNGEPGIGFIDTVNRSNPLPDLGPIQASNPCGEQYLHPYDNCNLGSLNLAAFVKDGDVDWERLRLATRAAVRLMDNVIDTFDFPVQQVTDLALKNRRIGLGIMGFADLLFQLRIGYNTDEGFAMAASAMGFVNKEAYQMSQELAEERGAFLNYDKSIFAKENPVHSPAQAWGVGKKMRNAALTTVAPTGSISMMFDTSSGIEPNFALAYIKQDKDGNQYRYFNRYFQEALDSLNLSEDEQTRVMDEVIEKGSIQHLAELPEELRRVFVVSMDISGQEHMRMQASFQRHVDNSISKTINFKNEATREDIAESFIAGWKLGCKSATVYRDGSRVIQILNVGKGDKIVAPTEAPSGTRVEQPAAEDSSSFKKQVRPRPEVMNGKTYRMKTGYGNLYITVNDDEHGMPFEVFATIGKSGGYFQEQTEAITRLISLSLRAGIQTEKIVDDLKGIRGPMPVFTDKGTILSLPDAIGKVLEEHIGAAKEIEEVLQQPENQERLAFAKVEQQTIADFGFMPGCPDCGMQLVMAEGCVSCKDCGFSRCS